MRTTLSLAVATVFSTLCAGTASAQSKPFTADDMVRLDRISEPRISPDGNSVVFTVRETDMDANRGRTDLWLLDLSAANAKPRRLTQHEAGDSSGRWAPDGKSIYFLSTRSGSSQVWRLSLSGGEAAQVTKLPVDVGALGVSPHGDRLVLGLEVFPDCGVDLDCTAKRSDANGKSKEHGRVYDRMFVRHWDTWKDGTQATLFSVRLNAQGTAEGAPVVLSGKVEGDVPTKPFGGDEDFAFSADGTRVVFSARAKGKSEPWSTNFDLYEVAADGSGAPRNLTADNKAWDAQPVFSPDGKYLAWLAMRRPGFEADRFELMVRDLKSGETRAVTKDWDRSLGHIAFSSDSQRIFATAGHIGQQPLWSIDLRTGKATQLTAVGYVGDVSVGTRKIVYGLASLSAPAELYAVAPGGKSEQLTHFNDERLKARQMGEYEQFSFAGANNETVYGFAMKPAGAAAGRKYPIAFIIHGGPQSSFSNSWSFRWNPQVYAAAGYGVVFIDFHGSTGYGQAFTDSISSDWGGKPLEDLQKGLTAALAKYNWLDGDKVCALGASYGGFMINWIAGNWPDRFKCLVNHDGVFDNRSMYYSTEELWFPEWDHGHATYYEKPENYEKFNPVNHVAKWKTPMLVVQGGLDFRVPDTQGLGAFTALQRRGIDSRLLFFPDENHWVLKPANSLQWHREVLSWLQKYLK